MTVRPAPWICQVSAERLRQVALEWKEASPCFEEDASSFASIADTAAGRGRKVEVYVNGQLMLTGSVAQVITNKVRDYRISADTELRFGFDIEVDDVVTVITR